MRQVKIAGATFAALVVISAGFWLAGLDATVKIQHVPGVVTAVRPYNGMSSLAVMQGLEVDVRLDDGRGAHVMAMKTSHLHVGDRVEIVEHKHGTGRVDFSWK